MTLTYLNPVRVFKSFGVISYSLLVPVHTVVLLAPVPRLAVVESSTVYIRTYGRTF